MSDTDWIVECSECEINFEGAEMIALGDGMFICDDCLQAGRDAIKDKEPDPYNAGIEKCITTVREML